MAFIVMGAAITLIPGDPTQFKQYLSNIRGVTKHKIGDKQVRLMLLAFGTIITLPKFSGPHAQFSKISHSGHGWSELMSNKLKLNYVFGTYNWLDERDPVDLPLDKRVHTAQYAGIPQR